MFERFKTPEELYNFKLGAALTMEHTVLAMLERQRQGRAERRARRPVPTSPGRDPRQQDRQPREVFAAFGWEIVELAVPRHRGHREGGQGQRKKEPAAHLVDDVLLAGAAATEHHEIAVYDGLITHAYAMGKGDVVELLRHNLEQEQHTLAEVKRVAEKSAAVTSGAPAP